MVKTICYGQTREWKNHKEAFDFFFEAYLCSEGSERERYANVLADIYEEKEICTDEEEY